MEINAKNYSIIKIKKYIKKNNLFLITNGANKKAKSWCVVEQNLKKFYCNYYQIFNKTTITSLNNSIFNKAKPLISGVTFFIKIFQNLIYKNVFYNNFERLSFSILALKLNKQFYSYKQLKQIHTLKYKKNKLIFCQFNNTSLKTRNNVI